MLIKFRREKKKYKNSKKSWIFSNLSRQKAIVFTLVLSLVLPMQFFGQSVSDTLILPKSKPKFMLGFDARNSFVAGNEASFFGIRTGLRFESRYKAGLGLYGVNTPAKIREISFEELGREDAIDDGNLYVNFAYFSFFLEPMVYEDNRWEITVPIHSGIGGVELLYRDTTDIHRLWVNSSTTLVEVSITAEYRIYSWLGIGAGLGYRQIILGNREIRKSLSAPIYTFNLKVYPGMLIKSAFGS
jgi:hypothetical protein